MRLRPSGSKGPVSVSLPGLRDYYASEAQTWEFMALTRARVVWASADGFAGRVRDAIAEALDQPRDVADVSAEVKAMRALMDRERPPSGFWDLKLSPGGQVDCEFAGQRQRLLHSEGGAQVSTRAMLADPALDPVLLSSWTFHQAIGQVLQAALDDAADPEGEPPALHRRLAQAVGLADLEDVKARMKDLRQAARAAFEALVSG